MSESKLIIQDKKVAVPGETIAVGMEFLPSNGTYRLNEKIMANQLGLVNIDGKVIKLIPLSGVYHPRRGDVIICEVIDVNMNGWRVNTNCAYEAFLSIKDASSRYIRRGEDLTRYFAIGDYIVAKIFNVTSQNLIDLTMDGSGLQKLGDGRIIKVNPHKVPRIIGKQGSMVSMIKRATGAKIIVGQNGVVFISGRPEGELTAINTIRMIEENAHTPGLTDKVKIQLEKITGMKLSEETSPQRDEEEQPEMNMEEGEQSDI